MPTYEYACQSCGQHIEVYQRFSDAPLTECGICGGPLRKVFHPAGILFKGSGFYKTDSRLGRPASGDAKEKRPAPEPASSESKAAAGGSAGAGSGSGSSADGGSPASAQGSSSSGSSADKEKSA